MDPGATRDVYLPMHARLLFDSDRDRFLGQNDYWVQMMGRLRPGVSRAQAQAALATPFEHWAASTATNDKERANLPVLHRRRRRRWTRQPAPPLFEAALRAAGDGGSDPGDRVCEHGESAARARDGPQARNGRAAQHRGRTAADRAPVADRERPSGVTRRRARHPCRHGRHPCVDRAAGQRPGGIHAARRAQLARAARHAGAVAAVRRDVRSRPGDAIHPPRIDADSQGRAHRRAAHAACAAACRV